MEAVCSILTLTVIDACPRSESAVARPRAFSRAYPKLAPKDRSESSQAFQLLDRVIARAPWPLLDSLTTSKSAQAGDLLRLPDARPRARVTLRALLETYCVSKMQPPRFWIRFKARSESTRERS